MSDSTLENIETQDVVEMVEADKTALAPSEKEAATVRRLLKSLNRRHPLRLAAETLLTQPPLPTDGAAEALACLHTSRPYQWKKQVVAAWLLGFAGGDDQDRVVVVDRLTAIVERWRIHNIGYRMARAAVLGFCLAGVTLYSLIHVAPIHAEAALLSLFLILTGIFGAAAFPLLTMAENHALAQVRTTALSALGRLEAVESLHILAAACLQLTTGWERPADAEQMRRCAGWALIKTLPFVQADHRGRLHASTVPNLCKVLLAVDEQYALPLLTVLRKIGDGREIETVSRLAEQAKSGNVRRAANGLLPQLRERQRREREAQFLLRASEASAKPNTLLRAAQTGPQTDAEHLLRAGLPKDRS